ncbi:MAG: hypothetical protein QNJ51_08270 [Calothrix sp. MO_167.B12]|nr:hypothetical protein [Calothrix sp. MO_167.B12]
MYRLLEAVLHIYSLPRLAKFRHPKKSVKWIARKYWHILKHKNWTFGNDKLVPSRQKITYNVGWVVACFHEVLRNQTQRDDEECQICISGITTVNEVISYHL